MTSTIAWLDTSSDEQRRVRELISLFTQAESRDELGIGQIRDAFSDTLFPGTSVIQTRARYFLFVPWIYRQGQQRGRSGPALELWADRRERKLIETLRIAGHTRGLIGRRAGASVKILPSTIYWSGLNRYGILSADLAPNQLGMNVTNGAAPEADELAQRSIGDWFPTLPTAPDGFPDHLDSGFALTADEAQWLSERILDAAPGTLLTHLVHRTSPPDADSGAPWEDTACADAPEAVQHQLHHAHLFSLTMHGAALLYNLEVGKRYEAAGHTRIPDPVDDYRDRLESWAEKCADAGHQLRSWDRDDMWQLVRTVNPRIGEGTRLFVNTWIDAVLQGAAATSAEDTSLQRLVCDRERKQKKAQSRLTSERLLRTWSGESGSAQLSYRWPTVRTLVTDIHEGAASARA
jgi:hypothetical protein